MEAAGETEGRTERAEPNGDRGWRYQRTSKLREPRVKVDTLRSLVRLTHAVRCRVLGCGVSEDRTASCARVSLKASGEDPGICLYPWL